MTSTPSSTTATTTSMAQCPRQFKQNARHDGRWWVVVVIVDVEQSLHLSVSAPASTTSATSTTSRPTTTATTHNNSTRQQQHGSIFFIKSKCRHVHCQPQKHEHWKLPCCCNRLLSNPCVNNDKNNRHKSFGLPTRMPRFVRSDPSPKVVLLLLRHAVPPAGLLLQAPLFR